MTFTIPEIRSAIEAAKLGYAHDVPEPLRGLAEEIARDTHYIYRITGADIGAYLEECDDDLTDQQREAFTDQVKKYIDNSGMFGESLQICLDLALADVLNEATG